MRVQVLFVIAFAVLSGSKAEIRLFMGEKFEDCSTPGPAALMDLSKLEYDYVNDTEYYLRGEVTLRKAVKSPFGFVLRIEKFDRGQWNPNFLNKKVLDLCPRLQIPSEPWYPFSSKLAKKECPYPAGYVEKFDSDEPISYAPKFIPPYMVGVYRAIIETELKEGSKTYKDCARIGYEIAEFV